MQLVQIVDRFTGMPLPVLAFFRYSWLSWPEEHVKRSGLLGCQAEQLSHEGWHMPHMPLRWHDVFRVSYDHLRSVMGWHCFYFIVWHNYKFIYISSSWSPYHSDTCAHAQTHTREEWKKRHHNQNKNNRVLPKIQTEVASLYSPHSSGQFWRFRSGSLVQSYACSRFMAE